MSVTTLVTALALSTTTACSGGGGAIDDSSAESRGALDERAESSATPTSAVTPVSAASRHERDARASSR